jgi:microcystin-dependent protein
MGRGYLTPNTLPGTTQCRVLVFPSGDEWLSVLTGALQELTEEFNWTPYGALTDKQAADAFLTMFDAFCFDQGMCRMIGEIIAYAGPTSPDARWLLCDGASLLRTDYPDLFAIVGTVYGATDSTHFSLPDLRGRTAISSGSGLGLSPRALGDSLGEEQHQLSTGELASHTHVDGIALPALGAALVGVPIPSAVPSTSLTGSTGGDQAHNNMQPSLAINYLIVALP